MKARYKAAHYLRFANSHSCLTCRNMNNGTLKGKAATKVRKETANDQTKRAEYLKLVEAWEDAHDTASGHFNNDGELVVPQWLDALEEDTVRDITVGGVFWPRSVLDRKDVKYDEKPLKKH